MKLEKIDKLTFARFQNFVWDASVYTFSPTVNILFGWNGSGKTTLSRIFRKLQQKKTSDCSFKITVDGIASTEHSDYAENGNKWRVFNDEYVEQTLRGSSDFPYIFFAGADAVEYADDEKQLIDAKSTLSGIVLPQDHDEIAKSSALVVKYVIGINAFRKELTGSGTYASYDKTDFEKRIKNIDERIIANEIKSHADLVRSDIEDLKTQLINSDRVAKNDAAISGSAVWLTTNIESVNSLLQSQPTQEVSKRVQQLGEKETRWVEDGVPLHFSDQKLEKCLFCGSTIHNEDELLKHFSKEVVAAMDRVDTFIQAVDLHSKKLAELEMPTPVQADKSSSIRNVLDPMATSLREKRNSITSKIQAVSWNTEAIKALEELTSSDATKIAYAIENHFVAQQYDAYKLAIRAYEEAARSRQHKADEVTCLDEKVRELKQKARNTHESAATINRLIKVVFPRRKIEIIDNDDGTGYVLKRAGELCDFSSLSEGERNFLALVYFVLSLNDAQSGLSQDGVVVIDDPVSSLDKQSIFQIYSIVVNEIKNHPTRQYFMLTHNLDFLGHLKEYFKNSIATDDTRMYAVTATDNGSALEEMPSLLKNHRSDYYYAFSVLAEYKDSCKLEDSYLVVNLLRRWLETFLEFKFATSGDLLSTLDKAYSVAKAETKMHEHPFAADHLEMYRFLSHGSHGFPDTESTDDAILLNADARIREAFELVRILDRHHFKKLEDTLA